MNGDDYVIDGDLAFSNSKDALKFYQTEYRKQQAEIEALKEALSVKVILNEHAQQSMKEMKELLK